MQPKFKVGEAVILQSKNRPELNGEYVIAVIRKNGEEFHDRNTGELCRCEFKISHFGYVLENCKLRDNQREHMWSEPSLRKKHQPGEMSFHSLMEWMKQPTKA